MIGPYKVTDNSGSFTGRGWRLSGRGGFEVFPDHHEMLANQIATAKNEADLAARKAVAKMLRSQAEQLDALNGEGVPASFIEKHNIESAILRHAADTCERVDLDWNAEALDAMERFVSAQTEER